MTTTYYDEEAKRRTDTCIEPHSTSSSSGALKTLKRIVDTLLALIGLLGIVAFVLAWFHIIG